MKLDYGLFKSSVLSNFNYLSPCTLSAFVSPNRPWPIGRILCSLNYILIDVWYTYVYVQLSICWKRIIPLLGKKNQETNKWMVSTKSSQYRCQYWNISDYVLAFDQQDISISHVHRFQCCRNEVSPVFVINFPIEIFNPTHAWAAPALYLRH